MQRLRPMCDAVLRGGGGSTLQAEVVGRQGGEGLVLGRLGGLRHDGGVVEDHPQAVLVVVNRILHAVHGTGAQEQLEMFYNCPVVRKRPRATKFGRKLTAAKERDARLGLLDLDQFG